MAKVAERKLFDGYCYGPADVVKLEKGDSTMWLEVRDPAGKRAKAVYEGCVYWRLGPEGIHFSLVREVTPEELTGHPDSVSMTALKRNARNVEQLLQEWKQAGLNFYLHLGSLPGQEYLVVAKSLQYQELE